MSPIHKPRQSALRSPTPRPSASTQRARTSTKGTPQDRIAHLVDTAISSRAFSEANLKTLRMLLGGRITASQRDALTRLTEHPERDQIFAGKLLDRLNKLIAMQKPASDCSPRTNDTPENNKEPQTTVERSGYRMTPRTDGGVQIIFEADLDRRSITVVAEGTALIRRPDDIPDYHDFCALLVALSTDELAASSRQSTYNFLAYVAQKLNAEPLAELISFVAANRSLFPGDFISSLMTSFQQRDTAAAEWLSQLAKQNGLELE